MKFVLVFSGLVLAVVSINNDLEISQVPPAPNYNDRKSQLCFNRQESIEIQNLRSMTSAALAKANFYEEKANKSEEMAKSYEEQANFFEEKANFFKERADRLEGGYVLGIGNLTTQFLEFPDASFASFIQQFDLSEFYNMLPTDTSSPPAYKARRGRLNQLNPVSTDYI